MTISFSKTKLLVATKNGIMESNLAALHIGCSVVESYDKVALDLDDKIARASKAFGALRKSLSQDSSLSGRQRKWSCPKEDLQAQTQSTCIHGLQVITSYVYSYIADYMQLD